MFRKINLLSYSALLALMILAGCSVGKQAAVMKESHSNRKDVRLIAVIPVLNGASDQQAALMLRDKVLNALYFKGYPRIPFQLVDEKQNDLQHEEKSLQDKVEYSRVLGEKMKIDAILYCDLKENRTVYYPLYSPISVAADFELRSARTGQLLWRNSHSTVRRNVGISKTSLRLKTSQDYEPAIQELVDKAMQSLPESPDVLG
ncbi:GNA1162 family protein [Syntrophus aciditrophicus]|uniref:Periplasmic protein n=1 Tax=Syntrophus aciditrophicus (strain SB) TaxID=56780 RepID=Q2LR17_SYNAS|nr:GNA1162 family protein [Syntrophus aciditrophicus]ABC76528.1 putative periplasmic protein [Syntrophus aciditrophicus SB]OPY18327.1 MAG: hypothetical protein A4E74_00648 [Syntrophus sp. PtaB.Bin075]